MSSNRHYNDLPIPKGIHCVPFGCCQSTFSALVFWPWPSVPFHPPGLQPRILCRCQRNEMSAEFTATLQAVALPLTLPSPPRSRLWQGWSALLINLPLSTLSPGNSSRKALSIFQPHSCNAAEKVSWRGDMKSQTSLPWRGSLGFHFLFWKVKSLLLQCLERKERTQYAF